jgi:hypothetical protein
MVDRVRRGAVVALLVVAVALATMAVMPAGAQTFEETVFVDNFGIDPGPSGEALVTFPPNWDVTAACNGAYPLTGSGAPVQVQSRRPGPQNQILLKIRNADGNPVSTFVRVNCAIDVIAEVPVSADQARKAARVG